jgi:hypothetical protein
MKALYCMFFFSLPAFSQGIPKIEILPTPKTIEDFDHQYKGCLENSECDQVMGHQLTRWQDLIKKVKSDKIDAKKKAQYLELFRANYGIPVEFYTDQKSQQGFKPMLFDSHCPNHNPKPPGTKTLKGTAFLKGLNDKRGLVWRDQSQIEVPVGELLTPQPVVVYYDQGAKTYQLPIGDQPLFLSNSSLTILREDDGFFYALRINHQGEWKIEDLAHSNLSFWEEKKQEVPCPKDKNPAPKAFGVEFCKLVWNQETKKTVIVRLRQGCAN